MYMLENKICQKQDEMPASKKKKKIMAKNLHSSL